MSMHVTHRHQQQGKHSYTAQLLAHVLLRVESIQVDLLIGWTGSRQPMQADACSQCLSPCTWSMRLVWNTGCCGAPGTKPTACSYEASEAYDGHMSTVWVWQKPSCSNRRTAAGFCGMVALVTAATSPCSLLQLQMCSCRVRSTSKQARRLSAAGSSCKSYQRRTARLQGDLAAPERQCSVCCLSTSHRRRRYYRCRYDC